MTEKTNEPANGSPASTTRSIDPKTARERADVEYEETTYNHDDERHCEADAKGRVVVGVTNDEGEVLVAVHTDGPHALLPNSTLEEGDGWLATARETAEDVAGASVTVGDPVRVRRVEHYTDGNGDPHNVTHHVVLEATLGPDAADDGAIGDKTDEDWAVDWYDAVPVDVDEDGDTLADISAFVE